MVNIKTIKYNNQQKQEHVYITKTAQVYNDLLSGKADLTSATDTVNVDTISRQEIKKALRDYLLSMKDNLKNKIIKIGYITTNDGIISLNENVITGPEGITADTIHNAMKDPIENKFLQSGEYNNQLDGKQLYGLSIAIFNRPTTKPPVLKTRSKFTFNF